MKRKNALLIISILMLWSSLIEAAEVKFNIVPIDSITAFLLPSNFTETIRYQVTNQTKIIRTLTMVPIEGVTQITTGDGVCASPFTLVPQQTCVLTLAVDGSLVPSSGIHGGPVICKAKGPNNNEADPLLCSQPSPANTLAVSTVGAGQHAYIANQLGNSVSFCQANPATGFLSNCAITVTGLDGPEAIGFNPAGTFFYATNLLGNTITVCQVDADTGALSVCVDAGGSGFNAPDGIAFNPDGTIAYISNVNNVAGVTACVVDTTTGLLSACINNTSLTFDNAADLAINSAGTLLYVVNRGSSTASVCNVSGQTVDSCNDLSGSLFNQPEGITINPLGTKAYIANAGDGKIIVCDIRQDASGLLDHCAATDGPFHGTGNVGLNDLGTFAYVPNQLLNDAFVCNASLTTGDLSSCQRARGTGFVGPSGIVLH